MIDIKNLDKARVLVALYNRSRPQGLGWLAPGADNSLTIEEAKQYLEQQTYFDYLRGRVLKVELGKDTLDPRLYDRDLGQGAAEYAILEEFTKPEK